MEVEAKVSVLEVEAKVSVLDPRKSWNKSLSCSFWQRWESTSVIRSSWYRWRSQTHQTRTVRRRTDELRSRCPRRCWVSILLLTENTEETSTQSSSIVCIDTLWRVNEKTRKGDKRKEKKNKNSVGLTRGSKPTLKIGNQSAPLRIDNCHLIFLGFN